jgi:DNA-binding FadR family transcriptional regulator
LHQKKVFDLYELRKAIELHGIRLAIRHAKDEDIAALQPFLEETGPEDGNRATRELVNLDETFHERLCVQLKLACSVGDSPTEATVRTS